MKPNRHTTSRVILCALFVVTATTAHAAQQCRLSNVAGRYGYTSNGTIVSPAVGPFVAVGQVRFTDSGTLSGSQTSSIGGIVSNETVEGTFAVNSDCTGSAIVSVYRGSTLVRTNQLDLVWDNNQREVRAIFLAAGTGITIAARKMFTEEED